MVESNSAEVVYTVKAPDERSLFLIEYEEIPLVDSQPTLPTNRPELTSTAKPATEGYGTHLSISKSHILLEI